MKARQDFKENRETSTLAEVIIDRGDWKLYCFKIKETAETRLNTFQLLLKDRHPELLKFGKIIYTRDHSKCLHCSKKGIKL